MLPAIQPGEWKRYRLAAIICSLIFIATQLLPLAAEPAQPEEAAVIDKGRAEANALDFAREQFRSSAGSAHTVHQSDSLLYGYLSKSNLLSEYEEKYGLLFPTDTYQTEMLINGIYTAYVYTHMETGRIVAWHVLSPEPAGPMDEKLASRLLAERGLKESALNDAASGTNGELLYRPEGYEIGDSPLRITVAAGYVGGEEAVVTSYIARFETPESYQTYVAGQQQLAGQLSTYGFLLMSGILFLVAIVCSILYAKHTSFKRGLLLSAIFLVFYLLNNYNMTDGLRATIGESANSGAYVIIMSFISTIMSILLGLSVYFSLVAGDGMWRARSQSAWHRFKEPGYGDYVWRSVGLGYLFAVIILGIQSVLLLILQMITGAWSTTDVSQSTYNMVTPLLLPMMAWCAAISEEAVYRLFGIALFEKLTGNKFVAILIPTVIWGFGHVSYPIYPSTTRLYELIVIGFIFAFIFLRYGLITAVFAHAIFDSLLMSSSLLFMGGAANVAASVFYMLLPVLIAWLIRWRHRSKGPGGLQTPA